MTFTTLISVGDLAEYVADPSWVVLDCRFDLAQPQAGEQAYREGHIPSARYANLDRDLSSPITPSSGRHPLPQAEQLAAKLAAWGVGPDTQVVVYDDANGAIAARAWWLLRWLGHERVAVLDGGWQRWVLQGLMVSDDEIRCEAAVFEPRPDRSMWLATDEVSAGLEDSSILLLDARAAARFRGEVEPIDPVAGHVPGAFNRPFDLNLARDNRFLAAEQLAAQFAGLLESHTPQQVVHMCGSGVTACHNLLAMEYAGFPGSRLYVGSWSEWIRDKQRECLVS